MQDICIGRYRHFKGNEYRVLLVARHSETEEEMQSETARQCMSDIGLSRENAEYVISLMKNNRKNEMVVYQALYGDYGYWVRPASMWTETVERDGHRVARFEYIGD